MISTTPSKRILTFLSLTFVISGLIQYYMITHNKLNLLTVSFLMWTPGVIAILCSLIFGQKLKDLAIFSKFKVKYLLLGFVLPLLVAGLILIMLLLSGIDQFEIHALLIKRYQTLPRILFVALIKLPLFGMITGIFLALGEEIGWRGFLHTHLLQTKLRYPHLTIGIIWAIWHIPLVLFTPYASSELPWLSAILLSATAILFSLIAGSLRTVSLSMWPIVILHASHNQWIQSTYPLFVSKGPLDQYFGGESGLFIVVIYAGLALLVRKKMVEN